MRGARRHARRRPAPSLFADDERRGDAGQRLERDALARLLRACGTTTCWCAAKAITCPTTSPTRSTRASASTSAAAGTSSRPGTTARSLPIAHSDGPQQLRPARRGARPPAGDAAPGGLRARLDRRVADHGAGRSGRRARTCGSGHDSPMSRSGVEAALTRRTSITAEYGFQWVDFDQDPVLGLALLGGTSQGGLATVRYAVTQRLNDRRPTTTCSSRPSSTATRFHVQNAQGGVEYQPSGLAARVRQRRASRASTTAGSTRRALGPALRAGLNQRFRSGSVDVVYSRSFVPALGFAGTSQNEEFTVAPARAPRPTGLHARRPRVAAQRAAGRDRPHAGVVLVRRQRRLRDPALDAGGRVLRTSRIRPSTARAAGWNATGSVCKSSQPNR